MSGFTCEKCGKEVQKLTAPTDLSRWVCNECMTTPDPLARLRELLDEWEALEARTYSETPDAATAGCDILELTATLVRVLREVLGVLDTQVTMKTPARVFKKAVQVSDLEDAIARGLDEGSGA